MTGTQLFPEMQSGLLHSQGRFSFEVSCCQHPIHKRSLSANPREIWGSSTGLYQEILKKSTILRKLPGPFPLRPEDWNASGAILDLPVRHFIGIWQTHSLSQRKVEFDNSTYGSCTRMNRSCKVNRERRCML